MNKKKLIIFVFILLALAVGGVGIFLYKKVSRKLTSVITVTPTIEDTDASPVKDQLLEKYPDFPIYYGLVLDRVYTKTPEGYEIVQTVTDPVDSIIFWYYEEFDEEEWKITVNPDIDNMDEQTVEATKDNLTAKVTANKVGEDTELLITIIEK